MREISSKKEPRGSGLSEALYTGDTYKIVSLFDAVFFVSKNSPLQARGDYGVCSGLTS